MEWKTVKLGDVATFSQGVQVDVDNQQTTCKDGLVRFIRIVDYTKENEPPRYIKHPGDKYLVDESDIVMIRYGTPGRVGRGISGAIANNMFKITIDENLVDKDFAFYYLSQESVYLYLIASNSSSTMPAINFKTVERLDFVLPPLDEQKRIAGILSSLDDKIENNSRINANLEAQAQALYKSWFIDFEPFGGSMPDNWKEGKLGDICVPLKEKVGSRDDVKVLSPVTTGQLVLSEEFFTKQVYSASIAKYIIVPPMAFAYNPARVNIGSIGMNKFDYDGCVSPVYAVFECIDGYEYFFDLFRQTDTFKEEVRSRAIGGVRQTLNYKDFELIETVIPSQKDVERFNELHGSLLDVIAANQRENKELANLRDTLLPKIMKGDIAL